MSRRGLTAGARRRTVIAAPRSARSATVTATTLAESTGVLPWVMPSRQAMRNAGRDVLAYFHTFPIYPQSSGSSNYGDWLMPSSQPPTGGQWRQRPYPIIDGNLTRALRVQYAKDDIATAANIGIDAFTFNILSSALDHTSQRWTEHIMPYYDAAAEFSQENTPGFTICPNPSMLSWLNAGITANAGADGLADLLTHPAAYKRGGRPVVIFYNVGNRPNTWYRDFYNRLLNTHGINAALIPSHQSSSPTGNENMDNYLDLFADGIFTALHPWIAPLYSASVSNYYSSWRTWCDDHGVPFMCGAGPRWENDRPNELKQIEGKGLTVIQNSWMSAINNNDPAMQIVSWSDHLESHNIRPSTGYQFVPYDVTAYYLAWYKRGLANPPTITRDAIFYAHRMHRFRKSDGTTIDYDPTKQTAGPYVVDAGGALGQVITHVFLTAAADVIVTIGGVDHVHTAATGGVFTFTDAMAANDTPRFRVVRGGVTVTSVTSAFTTRSGIVWQDLVYRMGSSTRPALPADVIQNDMPQDRV